MVCFFKSDRSPARQSFSLHLQKTVFVHLSVILTCFKLFFCQNEISWGRIAHQTSPGWHRAFHLSRMWVFWRCNSVGYSHLHNMDLNMKLDPLQRFLNKFTCASGGPQDVLTLREQKQQPKQNFLSGRLFTEIVEKVVTVNKSNTKIVAKTRLWRSQLSDQAKPLCIFADSRRLDPGFGFRTDSWVPEACSPECLLHPPQLAAAPLFVQP